MTFVIPSWRAPSATCWGAPPSGFARPLGGYRVRHDHGGRRHSRTARRARGSGPPVGARCSSSTAACSPPPVVVLQLMLATGRHLHAPKAEGGGGQSQATENVFWKLLLAILVIIVVSPPSAVCSRSSTSPRSWARSSAGIVLGPVGARRRVPAGSAIVPVLQRGAPVPRRAGPDRAHLLHVPDRARARCPADPGPGSCGGARQPREHHRSRSCSAWASPSCSSRSSGRRPAASRRSPCSSARR